MNDIKDVVADIVKHTATGFIENVKITGSDDETIIDSIDTNRTVIIKGNLHEPVVELSGELGFGNLKFLKGVLSLKNYKEPDSTVTVETREKNGNTIPDSLIFKDQYGNTDKYRFMSKEIIEQVLQTVKFKGANWDVTINPTKQKLSELQSAASIYGGIEPNISLKVENNELIVSFGSNRGSFAGKRVFAEDVDGTYDEPHSWNFAKILTILDLGMSGKECTMSVSSVGVMQITVDSGIGVYNYILPANTI
jgi:hypothetical protein